jgi:hypothetical protein
MVHHPAFSATSGAGLAQLGALSSWVDLTQIVANLGSGGGITVMYIRDIGAELETTP